MVIEDTETGVEKVGNKVNIRMATTKTLILAPVLSVTRKGPVT